MNKNTYNILLSAIIVYATVISSYIALILWYEHILSTLSNRPCNVFLLGVGIIMLVIILEKNAAWLWLIAVVAQFYIWV